MANFGQRWRVGLVQDNERRLVFQIHVHQAPPHWMLEQSRQAQPPRQLPPAPRVGLSARQVAELAFLARFAVKWRKARPSAPLPICPTRR